LIGALVGNFLEASTVINLHEDVQLIVIFDPLEVFNVIRKFYLVIFKKAILVVPESVFPIVSERLFNTEYRLTSK
jgi:hypothetical protein